MDRYAVVCCDRLPLAHIDDERPHGPLRIMSDRDGPQAGFSAAKMTDGHIRYSLWCTCKRWVPFTDQTLTYVIDKIAAARAELVSAKIITVKEFAACTGIDPFDDQARDRWQQRRFADLLAEERGEQIAGEPSEPPSLRYVIPFALMCKVVSERKRR